MPDLLKFTNKGIYCAEADVYIDPWKRVERALITHGHSDHARAGMKRYLCTHGSKPILLHRLGHQHHIDAVDYHEPVVINGVRFSFHPAGHVIGSAQIRVEHQGEIWVVSGDYKTDDDGISGAFEPIRCHTFITESTFGLPVYQWPDQKRI
ncbi:MAG: DNA ligase-associated DEXH box helicase, partial [Saprospiraceae bacterium]|nr:DNA ligase-associated DEXH box helicase [Saprospiraceae bacterium]